ncbi:MAG: hypothetical protein M3R41_01345 [Pseudomonadota bacterium]|nr:hypothetical protein [Pseudomonadota bacterium]
MRDWIRTSFTTRLIAGFALGAAGMIAVHAATATMHQDAPRTVHARAL